jgi:c-di-GMP-binding flagellar brake protein YcgR
MFAEDKRKHFRLPLAVPVQYKFVTRDIGAAEGGAVHDGITRDLSGGGLLLRAALPDKSWVGDLLTRERFLGLRIRLPGRESSTDALARVVWLEPVEKEADLYVMGLEFHTITTVDRDAIQEFIVSAYWAP